MPFYRASSAGSLLVCDPESGKPAKHPANSEKVMAATLTDGKEICPHMPPFSPNLILGVSDEPSPVCDIERVRRAAEILKE